MFRLFRKKTQRADQKFPVTGKVGGILARTVRKIQTWFATTLSEKERQLTIRQKKKALWIFCISMSVLSGYWICEGMFSTFPDNPDFLKHQAITSPQNTVLPDSLDMRLLRQFRQEQATKDSLADSVKR